MQAWPPTSPIITGKRGADPVEIAAGELAVDFPGVIAVEQNHLAGMRLVHRVGDHREHLLCGGNVIYARPQESQASLHEVHVRVDKARQDCLSGQAQHPRVESTRARRSRRRCPRRGPGRRQSQWPLPRRAAARAMVITFASLMTISAITQPAPPGMV